MVVLNLHALKKVNLEFELSILNLSPSAKSLSIFFWAIEKCRNIPWLVRQIALGVAAR